MTGSLPPITAMAGSRPSQPAHRDTSVRRFSCTQCGKCCNRSPEVSLSEASALADVFVFSLMFRSYALPSRLSESIGPDEQAADATAAYYEKKRLLGTFAAHKRPARHYRGGKVARSDNHLLISALAFDDGRGACNALADGRCGIYDRRPLACRTVPFHYSRAEALAASELDAFVATPGYRCDTSAAAEPVLAGGRIIAPDLKAARFEAIATAKRDRRWSEAIVQRMKSRSPAADGLPTVTQVEAGAPFGATTTSMLAAWQIAADAGLIAPAECVRLANLQVEAIARELNAGACSRHARDRLADLQAGYRSYLNDRARSAAATR